MSCSASPPARSAAVKHGDRFGILVESNSQCPHFVGLSAGQMEWERRSERVPTLLALGNEARFTRSGLKREHQILADEARTAKRYHAPNVGPRHRPQCVGS